MFTACEDTKDLTDEDNAEYSNGATVVKTDFSELIDKVGSKDPELIALIKDNPISKLKRITEKQKKESSEFYFDTDNIVSLKNDKNQVIFIIPAYKSNGERDNNLYNISINVNENSIYTKLTTIEINKNGTPNYSSKDFGYYTAKTSKVKELECYCTVYLADCTCHSTHAAGGCDHPEIYVFCGSCAGSGYEFSAGNPIDTSLSTNQIATVWSSSSNYAYSYSYSGNKVYSELSKIFNAADYFFSPLQKYNIVNTPNISNALLGFLNTDGNSQINKDFVLSILDAIEEGTVTNNQEFNVILNAFKSTRDFLVNNPEIKAQIDNFLIQNNSPEAKAFANELLGQMIANPGLKLDIFDSFKSPSNIDHSTIPITSPEGSKFFEVYGALTQSPEFKRLFLDVFGDNSRFNVKFKIGATTSGGNGETNTDLNNPILNTITISPQFLLTHNKMEIAKTILHECIHAFLNVKFCDPSIGMSIPNINNMELYNCINEYYNGFNSPNLNQHDFIYNFMVTTMVTILSEVKDSLVTPANNLTMLNDVVVHIPYNNSPATPFVWTDYYHNLSLNGLQDCTFFQNEIGSVQVVNGVPTPINTIDQVLMQSFIQYIRVGQFNINP